MGKGRLKFLLASELCLETPLRGVDPSAIRLDQAAGIDNAVLLNARYRAAERLVQLAIDESADFVLLLGDMLGQALPGGRGPWFLAEQLGLLDRAGIPVVWSSVSPVRLPAGLQFPARVQLIDASENGKEKYLRLERGTVRLVTGCEPAASMAADLTIALRRDVCSNSENALTPRRVDYIVQSGAARCVTARSACSGTVQGQDFSQAGEQGCLIVDWTGNACEPRFHSTDSVRWLPISIAINESTTESSILESARHHLRAASLATFVDMSIIRLALTGQGPLWEKLIDPREQAALLRSLRVEAQRLNRSVCIESLWLLPEGTQVAAWRKSAGIVHALGELNSLTRGTLPSPFAAVADAPRLKQFNPQAFQERLQSGLTCRLVHELAPLRADRHVA